MVFVSSFISGFKKILTLSPSVAKKNPQRNEKHSSVAVQDILDIIYQREGCCNNIFLTCEGRPVNPEDEFEGDTTVVATLKLKGGKGGFGSMLRAIGAQIEKTTNREACRDLSGRRLRDINEEKRLKEYLGKKVEKEKEMLSEKKKKLEQMKEGPKHIFEDKTYFEQREKREQNIYDSLDKAFSSSAQPQSSGSTSVNNNCQNSLKRKRLIDDLDDSSTSEEEEEEEEEERGVHVAKAARSEGNDPHGEPDHQLQKELKTSTTD